MEGYGLAVLTRMGVSVERVHEDINKARVSLQNKNAHRYNEYYVAYGRKPE